MIVLPCLLLQDWKPNWEPAGNSDVEQKKPKQKPKEGVLFCTVNTT